MGGRPWGLQFNVRSKSLKIAKGAESGEDLPSDGRQQAENFQQEGLSASKLAGGGQIETGLRTQGEREGPSEERSG